MFEHATLFQDPSNNGSLVRCLSMIVWTHAVLGVLYACVLHFCICTCLAQLRKFHMKRHSRNTLIVIIIIIGMAMLKKKKFNGAEETW